MPIAQPHQWEEFWRRDKPCRPAPVSWSKRRITTVVGKFIRPGGKALDAGCGSGFFSRFFCEQGMEVTALDYSDAALALTRETAGNRVRIIKADLTQDDLASVLGQKFNLIFSDGLLEHFTCQEQNRILANLLAVLAESGVIVTFVPNRWSPWQLIRPLFMPGISERPFTLPELIERHTASGLKVIASGGINTLPFRFSPDRLLGPCLGMLLYVVAGRDAQRKGT